MSELASKYKFSVQAEETSSTPAKKPAAKKKTAKTKAPAEAD